MITFSVQGYQLLKNGFLYGSVIPPEVNSLRIRDVSLGERLSLQLIALTEHLFGGGSNFHSDDGPNVGHFGHISLDQNSSSIGNFHVLFF